MIIKGKEYKDYIKSNIGRIPLEDYLNIMAYQSGFDSYDEMYEKGYRLNGYEDLSPNDILEYKEHLYDDKYGEDEMRGDLKPNKNINNVNDNSSNISENISNNDNNYSYNSNDNISKYHQEFIDYCKGKVRDLPLSSFVLGVIHPTLMLCSINGQENNAIVCVEGHENELCWRDSHVGVLNFVQNTAPDIVAVEMKFSAIDTKYYESLNKYWDDLRLDEIMEINYNRLHVVDDYNNKEM